jgi:hypothetical protein
MKNLKYAADLRELAEFFESHPEYRDVDCTIVMDSPAIGQKTIIRNDTGEEVKVELMTDEDKQLALDLQNLADAADEQGAAGRVPKSHRLDAGPDSWTDLGSDPKEPR